MRRIPFYPYNVTCLRLPTAIACACFMVMGATGCNKESASVDRDRSTLPAESNELADSNPDVPKQDDEQPVDLAPILTPEEIERNKLNDFTEQLLTWEDPTSVFELAHPESQVVLADEYQRQMLLGLYTNFLVDQQTKTSELIEIEDVWYPFDSGKFESPIRPTHMLICNPTIAQVSPKFESNAYWLLAKSDDEWKVVFPRHTADYIAELKRDEMASDSVEGKTEDELDELARRVAADLDPELRNSIIEWAANDKLIKAYFNLRNETGYDLTMVKKIVAAILATEPADSEADAPFVNDGTSLLIEEPGVSTKP